MPFKEKRILSGFDHPYLPVILDANPNVITTARWGLIPGYIKNDEAALEIQNSTLNARSESVFEKPSFRDYIMRQRCIVFLEGIYEGHDAGLKKTVPYLIQQAQRESIATAGIWSKYRSVENGEDYITFSILTTEANDFYAQVHNKQKRMPVILSRNDWQCWLSRATTVAQLQSFLTSYAGYDLIASKAA